MVNILTDILQIGFIVSVLVGMVRMMTPILLAALGELVTERAGIFNLGIEGIMLMGAFIGFLGAHSTGSLWIGVLLAILAGGLLGAFFTFLVYTLKTDQTITGLVINAIAMGLSFYWYRVAFWTVSGVQIPTIPIFPPVFIPFLSEIPIIGRMLFAQRSLTYCSLLMVPIIWFFLYRTKYGLEVRCLGENPSVLDMKGINITLMTYLSVIFGSIMASVGGAFLTLAAAGQFLMGISGGRGWLAIVIVIAGNWRVERILLGTLIFAFLDAFQLQAQSIGVKLPYQVFLALPYIMGVLILVLARSKSERPAALGVPYFRE